MLCTIIIYYSKYLHFCSKFGFDMASFFFREPNQFDGNKVNLNCLNYKNDDMSALVMNYISKIYKGRVEKSGIFHWGGQHGSFSTSIFQFFLAPYGLKIPLRQCCFSCTRVMGVKFTKILNCKIGTDFAENHSSWKLVHHTQC